MNPFAVALAGLGLVMVVVVYVGGWVEYRRHRDPLLGWLLAFMTLVLLLGAGAALWPVLT